LISRLSFGFAILFAVAYTQPFEFYSNQHQYYLHAVAEQDGHFLAQDWLANTTDPTPLFTTLASLSFRVSGPWLQHAILFLALLVYFLAMADLADSLNLLPPQRAGQSLAFALFTLSHAGIVRFASDRLLGADYPWFLQCGLANQYVLGPGLQPSVIGVLLLVSIACFCRGYAVWATGLAVGANVIHATYLLPAALLIAGYLCATLRDKGDGYAKKRALIITGVALALALPIAGFTSDRFQAVLGPKETRLAEEIIAFTRIPHHTWPARWLDIAGVGQLVLLLVGGVLLRRTRLFPVVLTVAVLACLGTAVVVITKNPTAALLFPYRISSVFIPIATLTLCAWVGRGLAKWVALSWSLAGIASVAAVGGAAAVYALHLGYQEPASEIAVMDFVKRSAAANDVYMLPARFPTPSPKPGVYSATFSKPPSPSATVFFELARFRIVTGARVYVDYKSIPYRDDEVLEWHRRVVLCEEFFKQKVLTVTMLHELRNEGITHMIAPKRFEASHSDLQLLHDDGIYRVFKVNE